VLIDVNLFAVGHPGFKRFGQTGSSGEAPDQLLRHLAAAINATEIGANLARNIPVSPRDVGSAIDTGQNVFAVADLRSGMRLAGFNGGTGYGISCFDELWAYSSERSRRLWDEMIPVPTRKISLRLTVTHAGFEGESALLQELQQRGLTQPLVGTDLHAGDGLLMFWSHSPVAPWQDAKWLAEMRRSLRPNQYLRMVENRFVGTESSFIEMEGWDACVNVAARPVVSDHTLPVWIGVDASVKRDTSALCAVTWDRELQRVRLVNHKIIQPSAATPINFEAVIEGTLLDWHRRYSIQAVLYDPYQMVASAQRLAGYGLPMTEYPQTPANLTEASQNLYELIKGRNLVAYPDEAIRSAITRAVAIETSRGWRIGKEKQTHKIDIVIALGMAALSALRTKPKQRIISGAIGVDGGITWYDPDTALPFEPGKPTRPGHLTRDEHGNTVLVIGAGSNDCKPGFTDAWGVFHSTQRRSSGLIKGQY
jgi:hypothetical protein